MSQVVFADIDPNTKSGTTLASDLNAFKDALLTQHSGSSSPTYGVIGTPWFDNSVANKYTMKIFDGSQWVTNFTLDTILHTFSYGGNNPTASFSITRTDTAADMFEMYRNTNSNTTGSIIYSQNNDGDTKKVFGRVKFNTTNVVSGSEESNFEVESIVAGTIQTLFKTSNTETKIRSLEGIGTRNLTVDDTGVLRTSQIDETNLFQNGKADTADLTTYTETTLVLSKSVVVSEVLSGESVFKLVSSAASEELKTETITLKNIHNESPLAFSLDYKSGSDWTIEIRDQLDALLHTETLSAFTPTVNEGRKKKFFTIPTSANTGIYLKIISTTNDTLFFDNIEIKSLAQVDETLYMNELILNNQTNTILKRLITAKETMYKVEAQIKRQTDTEFADAIYELLITNDGVNWRIAKQNSVDLEPDEANVDFAISGNNLIYTSNQFVGTNYTGNITARITRTL